MLTIIFVSIIVALLVVGGIFALMAKSNRRRGQSGSPGGGEGTGKESRAPGLD